ncbi:hypothetical protein [Phyllobacterium brassicacearum]|nr:hypothetical protein [Phyllobacterium brassicacearum]
MPLIEEKLGYADRFRCSGMTGNQVQRQVLSRMLLSTTKKTISVTPMPY